MALDWTKPNFPNTTWGMLPAHTDMLPMPSAHPPCVLHAMLGLSEPGIQVGSDSEFGQTWLQRAGRCADSSFVSRISVAGRGLVARSDGEKGREVGSYKCGVGRISW